MINETNTNAIPMPMGIPCIPMAIDRNVRFVQM